MRSLFSLVGLVIVVAVIGLIASRQLSGRRAAPATLAAPPGATLPVADGRASTMPAQYKQALDAAMQTARPMEGDAK